MGIEWWLAVGCVFISAEACFPEADKQPLTSQCPVNYPCGLSEVDCSDNTGKPDGTCCWEGQVCSELSDDCLKNGIPVRKKTELFSVY